MKFHRRTLKTAAMLGLSADHPRKAHDERRRLMTAAAAELLASIPPGGVALVTGPSGSGKSTLLDCIVGAHPVEAAALERERRAVAELSRLPLEKWLRLLAQFGLGEGSLMLQPAMRLSAGQKYRLALALNAARVGGVPGAVFVADEFCSLLDRECAHAIAAALSRWANSRPDIRIVCATAHDDLQQSLNPNVILTLDDDTAVLATK